MKILEEAYECIALALINSAQGDWKVINFAAKILGNTCSSMCTTQITSEGSKSIGLGFENGFKVSDAAIVLRDEMKRATGQRIWGLNFSLFPTGKFKIEYDYTRPEGYEEADEVISVGEALARLDDLDANSASNL